MSEKQRESITEALAALQPNVDEPPFPGHVMQIEIALLNVSKGNWEQPTTKQLFDQLNDYGNALEQLTQAINAMSPMALGVLRAVYEAAEAQGEFQRNPKPVFGGNITRQPEPPSLGELPRYLFPLRHEYLLYAARYAADDLRGQIRRQPGEKPNIAARWLACRLAEIYFEVTGNNPTIRTDWDSGDAYGPFLDFVRAILKLTKLKAAPITYAEFAVDYFKKNKGKIQRQLAESHQFIKSLGFL